LLAQRGADLADIPGGSSGLLLKDYKGDRLVTRIDPGVIAPTRELRITEKQAEEFPSGRRVNCSDTSWVGD
jgi:hypothetical protein